MQRWTHSFYRLRELQWKRLNKITMLSREICQKARMTRDARFDGQFFTAVKTTGIFCRSICPATTPKEEYVEYYPSEMQAARAGYRPCLCCRPDSAPGSVARNGVDITVERAIRLINEGALQIGSLQSLSERLGISDRHLRQLFIRHLGVPPKAYALYQQCLFAKKLLHETTLPLTSVALASGFNSIRRFNHCFKTRLGLMPSQVRSSEKDPSNAILLKLYYRPPYDWDSMQVFLAARFIPGLEWIDSQRYGRTFEWAGGVGYFTARHIKEKNRFDVSINVDNLSALKPIVSNIRRILDLDTNIEAVEACLHRHYGTWIAIKPGLRLPGTWNMFEAGMRAILGQQVSVTAARKLVERLVGALGRQHGDRQFFPRPLAIAESELTFLKTPTSRKQTLRNLARLYVDLQQPDEPEQWLSLKGIGPWTVDYARLRGISDPDVYLGGDLGVKKAVEKSGTGFNPDLAAPWRSYLTFQLWNQP